MLAEDIPDMDFAFGQIWLSCFVNEFAKPAGRAYKKILAIFKGYHLWFYYGEKDSNRVGEHIVKKFCVYYAEKGVDKVFLRKQAKELAQQTQRDIGAEAEISGQTGCVGRAIGVVKKIFRPEGMGKMKKGDILVSIATDPDIVPAMKKAAAIVTEQGGVTSHAAIVSREMNIPCVIGTKIATKVLNDGDKVEVDANKGIVRKI